MSSSAFPCTRCGLCCAQIGPLLDRLTEAQEPYRSALELFPYEPLEDGSCPQLTDAGSCAVFDERPVACRLDAMYERGFEARLDRVGYYERTARSCNQLMEIGGAPAGYRIPVQPEPPGLSQLVEQGWLLLPGVLDRAALAEQLARATRRYDALPKDHESALQALRDKGPWVPTASSILLGEDGAVVRDLLLVPALRALLRPLIGSAPLWNVDQSWLRRQHPPASAPPLHSPHAWHQDGGLGFDYRAGRVARAGNLLRMVTAWAPLVPCGAAAPGIELMPFAFDRLLSLDQLKEEGLRELLPHAPPLRPVMAPGDLLLMLGGLLHRTHVTEAMTRARTSVELRFFPGPELPERLADQRALPLAL